MNTLATAAVPLPTWEENPGAGHPAPRRRFAAEEFGLALLLAAMIALPLVEIGLRQFSVGFSATMNAVRSPRVRVVDLMCHTPAYQASLFSGDGFHPNDAGYALVADLVWAALASPPPPPPATCPEMS